MVSISEFLPNPIGDDRLGEWIKLFNDGDTAVVLDGWVLKDASGKSFNLQGLKIAPGDFLVLDFKTTRISLNNDGETLFLYDSSGKPASKISFEEAVGEGEVIAAAAPPPAASLKAVLETDDYREAGGFPETESVDFLIAALLIAAGGAAALTWFIKKTYPDGGEDNKPVA